MLCKRIIACLDVKDGKVVKGTRFKGHQVLGEILELAKKYSADGADELVFYDITASTEARGVSRQWVEDVAREINIPFCVAGGIRSVSDARQVLNAGADKISINTPALERPELITELADVFGTQAVVVGIDSLRAHAGASGPEKYRVHMYTGNPDLSRESGWQTLEWVTRAQNLGAGEIVLNCMDQDGVGSGYDIEQLKTMREVLHIPLIASGGARIASHFADAFIQAHVEGALAAGAFHRGELQIPSLKRELKDLLQPAGMEVRI